MRVVAPMIVMLIAGLAVGSACSTLMWSSQLDRGLRREAEWRTLVEKQNATITSQTETIQEQNAALRRLTASTDGFLEALKNHR